MPSESSTNSCLFSQLFCAVGELKDRSFSVGNFWDFSHCNKVKLSSWLCASKMADLEYPFTQTPGWSPEVLEANKLLVSGFGVSVSSYKRNCFIEIRTLNPAFSQLFLSANCQLLQQVYFLITTNLHIAVNHVMHPLVSVLCRILSWDRLEASALPRSYRL